MNMKSLFFVALAILVLTAALKISEDNAPQTEIERAALYPSLLEQVNQIQRVTLRSADHKTDLVRSSDQWKIANKDNFTATGTAVKRLLLEIAELRTVEAKTSTSENYSRLGVEDIGDDATGTQIEIIGDNDKKLVNLIVGHAREGSAGDLNYVRRADEAGSWLAHGKLDLKADPIQWLDASIVDIDTERVREVLIEQPDSPPIQISKTQKSDNFFALQNVPEGFQAKSKTIVSSLGAVLLDLRFNDVAAAGPFQGHDALRTITVRTFNGLTVKLSEFARGEETFTQFTFSADGVAEVLPVAEPETASESLSTESSSGDGESPSADGSPENSTPQEPPGEEAQRLGEHTSAWVYVLPKYKRRMFDRKFESLIKPLETQTAED